MKKEPRLRGQGTHAPDDPDDGADDGDEDGEQREGQAQEPPERPAIPVAAAHRFPSDLLLRPAAAWMSDEPTRCQSAALLLAGVGLVATREHQGDKRSPVPVYMKACSFAVSFLPVPVLREKPNTLSRLTFQAY